MAKPKRFDLIDALRGLAVILMVVFHFCFLLKEFNLAFDNFHRAPFWLNFRTLIVILFLTLVGVSLKIATHNGLNKNRYLKRLAQLLFYGSLISITTYYFAPQRMVIFGILQFIFIASILGLLCVHLGCWNLLFGSLLCFSGIMFNHPFFDQHWFWIGFMTHKPVTIDYVPLLPWFGVVMIGVFLGDSYLKQRQLKFLTHWQAQNRFAKGLIFIGQHSLNIYMLHMPILAGIIYALLI